MQRRLGIFYGLCMLWLALLATPLWAQNLCTADGHFSQAAAASIDFGFGVEELDTLSPEQVTGQATPDPDPNDPNVTLIDYDNVSCPVNDDTKFISGVVCLTQSVVAFSMFEVYCGVLDYWRPIFFAALVLWFALYVISMVIGLKDPSKWGVFVVDLTKILFIVVMVANADTFYTVAYRGFLGFVNDFLVIPFDLVGVSSPGASFEIIDSLFNVMVGEAHTHSMTVLAGALALSTTGFGVMFSFLLGTGLVSMFWSFIRLITGYATSFMALTFLLMFFPVFLTFLLFKQSSRWGINYIASLLGYSAQIVFTMIFVFTIVRAMSMPITELTQTLFSDQKDTIIVRDVAHLDMMEDAQIIATAEALGSPGPNLADHRTFIEGKIENYTAVDIANLRQDDHPIIMDGCSHNPDFNSATTDGDERTALHRWTATNAMGYFDIHKHTFVRSRYKTVTDAQGYPIAVLPKASCSDYESAAPELLYFDPVDKIYKKGGNAITEAEYNQVEYLIHAFETKDEVVETVTPDGTSVELSITKPPVLDLSSNDYNYYYTVTHPGDNGYRGMNACPNSVEYNDKAAGVQVTPLFACGLYLLGTDSKGATSNMHINVPGPMIAAYPSRDNAYEEDSSGALEYKGFSKIMKLIFGFVGVWLFTDMILGGCLSLIPKLTKNMIEFFQYRGMVVTTNKSGASRNLLEESGVGPALTDINQIRSAEGLFKDVLGGAVKYSGGGRNVPGFGAMRSNVISARDSVMTYLGTQGMLGSESRQKVRETLIRHRQTVQQIRSGSYPFKDGMNSAPQEIGQAIGQLQEALREAGGSHWEIEEMIDYLQMKRDELM